ncbi:MAG: PKD domain-containing protein [Prolixibacteraceae bacterium]|nr:PKD domain-containing protein [Prolixibacteraceae bacterium]
MAAKLTEITTQYHTFVDNQVLTKDQLNEFINYFEDQDRMSRIFLTGTGIVCGFKLNYNAEGKTFIISQGTGITSDGDLLKLQNSIDGSILKSIDLEQIEYSWVKKFEDNFANYRFFKRLVSVGGKLKEEPLDLWEILPEKTENAKALGTLADLDKKVVLLYLENYAKDGDLCTAVDCDNQGIEQVARLRVLLVSQKDADYILGLDSMFSEHHKINTVINLPDVAVRRVVLNQINTASYDELKKAYYTALNSDNLVTNLTNGIKSIVADFKKVLGLTISSSNLNVSLSQLQSLAGFSAYNVPFNVQYRYDCIKDIVDTYNEIKQILIDLNKECNPDINAFPKHLLLGSLEEVGNEVQNYRHGYYKSPAISCGKDKIEQCRSLVSKLFKIIAQFKTSVGEVKITPSNKLPELSFKSIPFYYSIDETLLESWNFDKTQKLKSKTNLGYHRELLSSSPQIQEPLNFNIDDFDFYRIEGHQGKDYKTALEEIDDLKNRYGLAFDVKALSVNLSEETLNVDDYECEFEDLNVLLKAWTAEQNCVLAQVSQFFSGYSLVEPGANVRESAIDVKRGFIAGVAANTTNNTISNNSTRLLTNLKINEASKTGGSRILTNLKSNVIADNLTTEENTLGNAMKIALEENKDGSVNDIIAKAENLVAEKVNADVWKEQPAVKDLVVDKSIQLMAYSHVLTRKMPDSLIRVNVDAVNDYKLTLSELCKLVERLKKIYQTVELSAAMKALMGVLITQLSSICCSAKKLELLLDEINKRKEKIILSLKLSKFVENNPGLEHKAGVQPGGTFILVYLNKKENIRDSGSVKAEEIKLAENDAVLSRANRLSLFDVKETPEINVNLTRGVLLNEKEVASSKLELLNKAVRVVDLPNNTVVADFSLPYMCCSDCSPINFIIEKPPVTLRLDTDHYCLGKDTQPLTFEVSPADGEIKANPEVEGMIIEGTKLLFNTDNFPDEMLGQPISFTVNDQITNCEIKVYRAVEFDFDVPESPTSETTITFVPTGNLDGASFLWSFGDDNLSIDRNPTHQYVLPVNDENKVTVSLTVTAPNGICQTTVEHEISFAVEDIKIALDGSDFCENDQKNYPFVITPQGTDAKIEGKGVQQGSNGGFIFIPAAAGPGEIEFILNGEPSGVKATVHHAPVASFNPAQVENQLVLTNTSTHAEKYTWLINGEKVEKPDANQVVIDLTPNSPNTWKLQLVASSEICGSTTSREIVFTTRFVEEPPVNNCIEETKAAILNDLKAVVKLKMDSNIVHPIWLETSIVYGGKAEFNNGVLNDIKNFLSGKNDGKLQTMFEKLLDTTVKQIIALNPRENKEEYIRLTELFQLQLQLFYNVLGCQNQDIMKEFGDSLQSVFDLIIQLLLILRERQIILPDSLSEFMKLYAEKVKNIEMLARHISIIFSNNLV